MMNPLQDIISDDEPDPTGIHLYPEQRAQLFESWWEKLSLDARKELASADFG